MPTALSPLPSKIILRLLLNLLLITKSFCSRSTRWREAILHRTRLAPEDLKFETARSAVALFALLLLELC